jgi:hypothetical protein
MPNVEVAGSGTTGWLCTIQPLSANGTSGLFRYSMPGASAGCTKERYENYTAGLVSVLDPAHKPALPGQKNRQVSSLAWHSLPARPSPIWDIEAGLVDQAGVFGQRGFGARTLIRWPRLADLQESGNDHRGRGLMVALRATRMTVDNAGYRGMI